MEKYNGLSVGDNVDMVTKIGTRFGGGKVIALDPKDEQKVYIETLKGFHIRWLAEWCSKLNQEVEQINNYQEMAEKKDNAVIIFEGTDQLIEQTIAELKKSTITDEALTALKEQYGNLIIGGIEDMKGYKAVKGAVTQLRQIRTSVEARRKELTEPALKFQREVKAEADRITAEIKPLEDRLKEQVISIDDAREAARKVEYQRRLTLLTESGYQVVNGFMVCGPVSFLTDQIVELTDEQLEYHVNHGKGEIARQIAEEERKKAESEAIRAEREELQRMREELALEKAKAAKELEELRAQKEALEKTYETVVEPVQAEPVPTAAEVATEFVNTLDKLNQEAKAQEVKAEPVAPKTMSEFERGFNAFRIELMNLVGNPETKLTRALLMDWAKNVNP